MDSTSHDGDSSLLRTEQTVANTTILVVEDDVMVRKLISGICSCAGLRVLEASSGAEALTLCETYPQPIHVMITDLEMPGISGHALPALVTPLRSDIKVIICSGSVTPEVDSEEGVDFLQKPFTRDTLLGKIRNLVAA